MQAPAPQAPQKPIPGVFAFGFDHLEIDKLSPALTGDAIGAEHQASLDLAHQPDPHTDSVEDQIAILIGEPTLMEAAHRDIQNLGHRANGRGADALLDQPGQRPAALASRDTQKKYLFEG